jgi:hypothetical protein
MSTNTTTTTTPSPPAHELTCLPTHCTRYGVQFSPYEGTADGVMICGVTEGGPGDGKVKIREKVIGINNKPCAGLTYVHVSLCSL